MVMRRWLALKRGWQVVSVSRLSGVFFTTSTSVGFTALTSLTS